MIEVTLSSGTVFKGEEVKNLFDWMPFDSKGICLSVTETETYTEPKSKEAKTREVKSEVFIKKECIVYVKKVKV